MANILEDVQIYVADKLNSDSELSGLCPFIVENKKDVDYEIKQALGKQGVVGLVMTPKATYAGAYMDVGVAWQIDELEVDIVENVSVNRGKKDGYVTGQDAAMRLFEVMCPLSGETEGQFNPVSYEEGEDNSLLVNKCLLKCLVHNIIIPANTIVQFSDGTSRTYDIKGQLEIDWLGSGVYVGDVVGVEIGEGITGLGERSFTGFGQLSSIVVPKNVTSIGNEAFSYTGLRNVVIENGVTELGYGVFSYSNGLSSITLPSTLLKIGADVFEECGGLSSIVLPKSVVDISRVAFRYSRLSAVTMDGRTKAETKAIDGYPWGLGAGSIIHCTDGDIVVGLTKVTYTDGRNVELDIQGELGEASIPDREYISEVDIGSAVTSIGDEAFDRCAYLETVIIPESVETIGTMGFSRTVRLTSITIKGNGLKVIGLGAFAAETALSSISLPDSVVSIGRSAFEDCVSLTSIDIPASVQTMDREVFFGCSELMSVTFSGKTKSTVQGMSDYSWGLPSGCVLHCTDGDIVVGSTTVVYQGGGEQEIFVDGELTRNSIPNISNVASVNIGEAVTSIEDDAFSGCKGLTSVTMPDSVTSIGYGAFLNCFGLTSVTIGNGVTSIGNYAFCKCLNLANLTIGNNVTSIGEYAFQFDEKLTTLVIPDSVTSIGYVAFGACSGLTSMTIGSGATSIGAAALGGCPNLMDVTFSGKTKATVQGMENYSWELPSGCVIHCTDKDITVGV